MRSSKAGLDLELDGISVVRKSDNAWLGLAVPCW